MGNYVPVKDERFGIEKNIRIQKVTKNLLVEHDYTLTLSDITAISPITQTVVDVGRHETIIENNRLRDLTKARRGWRTTEELRTMVYDTDGYFDPENIKPNSIDTNMLTVGSKSQQFVLIDVILQANVNGISNRFDASAGVLAHLTIDDEIIKHWNMAAGSFTLSSPKGYYVFAKCSQKSTDGIWYVTQEQLKVEPTEDPNNYYFQVGILGSVHSDDDFRDFTTTYGFTRINGNTITTGKIITSDKECYLDLDGNKFRIGDSSSSIDWNVTAKRQLTLHNVRLLSDSGDTSHIGVFRGTYNPKYVYYAGDEVAYTVIGETCTYRYTNPTPSMGNLPTNSVYWSVVAKGSTGDKGESGLSVFYTYNDSETKPATPTGDGSTGGWHRTSSENVVWMSIKNAKTDAEGAWGIPFRVRGADGTSINIKGSKENVSQLPTVGNSEGDAYLIGGNLYIWDGTNWKDVGAIKGEDGKSSYLHKKYSDDGGKTFTAGNGETPGRWLGLYVDMIPTDSDKPSAYKWSDTKGQDGTPGLPGEDGRTPYFHIKYSDNGGMSFTANNGEEPGDYIGQYTDYVQKDSDNPMDYTWALIKGESGTGGTDAGAGEYYEYRYAKNGSTLVPPDLDVNSSNPTGWSTEMPKVGALEYIWCTMAKKSGLADRTKFHLPIEANDTSSIADISGNGYNGVLGGGTVVKDGTRYALNLSGGMESCIPYDLPFGESFTLCFWMKSDQNQVKWMLNGYNGRHYVEKSIVITPNTWFHLAFRFNDRTVTVFKNGEQLHSGSVNIMAVGFAIYDDDVFGSAVYFDDVRLLMGALPVNDIASVMNGKADLMIQKWSTPIRVNPYDGEDGKPGVSVTLADVEYAQSTSNSVAPTTGWQTTAPTWIDGRYIWSRTKVSYSDNTTTYTKAVCITGGKGSTGNSGVGVSSIIEQYYLSSSATSLLNGSWSTTRPTWKDKWYIWTRSVITYTNGTSDTTAAICVTGSKGDKGEDGKPGVSVTLADVEYAQSTSNSVAPTTGWQTTAPTWIDGRYIWSRTKVSYSDNTTTYTKAVCITGGKGSTGNSGVGVSSIIEQYYLSSSATSLLNGSWSTTRPTWKDKWYIWTRSVITYTNGTSDTTAAICVTGSKGDKGEDGKPGDKGEKGDSPVLVYRGIYDSSKTYYGNSKRLDAVKYNNQYYIARIDAGTFTGFVPTNTGKWNTFGAQFETIATNLLLAEGANIGDWFTKGGKIVSTMDDGNKIELDASMARIYIESSSGGGDYALVDFGAKMTIDANRGIFETRAKNAPSYSNAVSYMSPTGIFSNMAGTDGMPASSGYTHRGAIVGLGFANVPASTWAVNVVDTIVAGVYGRASNSGTAPAFGGFFYDLFAGGLIFGRKCITGTSNNTWYLNREDTVVIGYTSAASVVYLPASPKEGQVIFVKQWWRGYMRFRPRSGYLIYDDTSVNDYYDFGEGQGGMFVYTVGYVDGVKKQAWLVSRWKY